jgi:hypothetical protein
MYSCIHACKGTPFQLPIFHPTLQAWHLSGESESSMGRAFGINKEKAYHFILKSSRTPIE